MTKVANIIAITALVIALLDIILSPQHKKIVANWLFSIWATLYQYSFRQLALRAIKITLILLDRIFGPPLFVRKFLSLVFAINASIFFAVLFVVSIVLTYQYFHISTDIVTRMKADHVAVYEKKILELKEMDVEQSNDLFDLFQKAKKSNIATYTLWAEKTRALSINDYRKLMFITPLFRTITNALFGVLISLVLSTCSLAITYKILARTTDRNLMRMILLDIFVAFVISNVSFVVMILFRAGEIVPGDIVNQVAEKLYVLVGVDPIEIRGIMPTPMDVTTTYAIRLLYSPIELLTYQWGQFLQTMLYVFSGKPFLVTGSQAIWNWTIVLSFAPTILHLVSSFLLLIFVRSEPILRKPLTQFAMWLHDHPRGPVAAISCAIAGLAILLGHFSFV